MTSFGQVLRARGCEFFEWMDYRREASFWKFFFLPPLLSAAWAYCGWIGLGIVVGSALLFTAVVAFVSGIAVVGWIVGQAAIDALTPYLGTRDRTAYSPSQPPLTLR